MPFGFGGPPRVPMSKRRHLAAAQNCRLLADGFLDEAVRTGDETFFQMALQAEHDAAHHEEIADYGGYRRE